MSETVNTLKEQALQLLTTESFRYLNQMSYQECTELARENAIIRGVNGARYFMYAGLIYPDKSKVGDPMRLVNVVAPPLHYSLYERFDEITKRTEHAGLTDVSNYFRAVISYSINGVVLDALLPAILVNKLREEFTVEEFSLINDGDPQPANRWESVDVTLQTIEKIKIHYASTIRALRDMLMDKLLMASG